MKAMKWTHPHERSSSEFARIPFGDMPDRQLVLWIWTSIPLPDNRILAEAIIEQDGGESVSVLQFRTDKPVERAKAELIARVSDMLFNAVHAMTELGERQPTNPAQGEK